MAQVIHRIACELERDPDDSEVIDEAAEYLREIEGIARAPRDRAVRVLAAVRREWTRAR
jgi:hypothetical protein